MSLAGMALMFFGASSITRCFIDDAATVEHGRVFLRIVCLACPTTALNFLAITIFQAVGRRVEPLVLSLLRKGGLDIPLMLLFSRAAGVGGVAWATPLADALTLCIAAALVLPYLRSLRQSIETRTTARARSIPSRRRPAAKAERQAAVPPFLIFCEPRPFPPQPAHFAGVFLLSIPPARCKAPRRVFMNAVTRGLREQIER